MIHFEDTWKEAEEIVDSVSPALRILKITDLLSQFETNSDPEILGEILLEISGLSKDFNINVDAALKEAINNKKIEDFE